MHELGVRDPNLDRVLLKALELRAGRKKRHNRSR